MHLFMIIALIAWLLLGSVLSIALVGKPRDPISPATAAASTLIAGLFIAGILAWLA